VQDVKSDVIKLNRDLLVLEEELLFPANTQVALFVSMDVGKMFELDSVQIKLDDKVIAAYLYTPLEVAALHRGGVQRVWVGNLKTASTSWSPTSPARARTTATTSAARREVRQGHRGQVHRAAHQGLDGQAPARVRRQALAVGTAMREASLLRKPLTRSPSQRHWRWAPAPARPRPTRPPSRTTRSRIRTTATPCSTSSRTITSRR
jgi:hypothetical protein